MPSKPIYYYANGKFLHSEKATLSIHDIGFLRGFALFESLRTYGTKPFLLREHLLRLKRGLQFAGIHSPKHFQEIPSLLSSLILKNKLEEALIRIYVTGGQTRSLTPQGDPSLILMVDPYHPFPNWQYTRGIAIKTTPHRRIHPQIKSTVYFSAVFETQKALREGYHEVAYRDSRGSLLEGTTYSVFAVLPGPKLVTPKEGVLEGITANQVIEIAQKNKIRTLRSPLTPSLIKKSLEMFITSSNRELIPVIRVDRQKIGNGKPGPVTEKLHRAYQTKASLYSLKQKST